MRNRRWFKALAAILTIGVVVAIAIVATLNARESDLKALRAMGVPTTREELCARLPKEGANAAAEFTELAGEWQRVQRLISDSYQSVAKNAYGPGPSKAEALALLSRTAKTPDYFNRLESAAHKPRTVFREGSSEAGHTEDEARQFSEWIELYSAKSLCHAVAGDHAEALNAYEVLLLLGHHGTSPTTSSEHFFGFSTIYDYGTYTGICLAETWASNPVAIRRLAEALEAAPQPPTVQELMLAQTVHSLELLSGREVNRLLIDNVSSTSSESFPNPLVTKTSIARGQAQREVLSLMRRFYSDLPDNSRTYERASRNLWSQVDQLSEGPIRDLVERSLTSAWTLDRLEEMTLQQRELLKQDLALMLERHKATGNMTQGKGTLSIVEPK